MGIDADAIVLGCVKRKAAGRHPARDLYTSTLWRRRRRYADASGLRWFIFSAEHGLIDPGLMVAWYDGRLDDLARAVRAAKGEEAAVTLEGLLGGLGGKTIEVHAGATYVSAIRPPMEARGGRVLTPLAGLSIGRQYQWYDRVFEEQ